MLRPDVETEPFMRRSPGKERRRPIAGAVLQRVRSFLPFASRVRQLSCRDAYRLWAEHYHDQSDNAVIVLENEIFGELLGSGSLVGRMLLDIGCGTGRHWRQLLSRQPHALHGADVSPEMLAQLRARHPNAVLHLRAGTQLLDFRDATFDLVLSTLMLGHVRDAADELREWTRVLKRGGEIILTDFHPAALSAGAKRTFKHGGDTYAIETYLHPLDELESLFRFLNLGVVAFRERKLSDVRFTREKGGDPARFDPRALEIPLVFGFRLRLFSGA